MFSVFIALSYISIRWMNQTRIPIITSLFSSKNSFLEWNGNMLCYAMKLFVADFFALAHLNFSKRATKAFLHFKFPRDCLGTTYLIIVHTLSKKAWLFHCNILYIFTAAFARIIYFVKIKLRFLPVIEKKCS